jgi:hypothetical protein
MKIIRVIRVIRVVRTKRVIYLWTRLTQVSILSLLFEVWTNRVGAEAGAAVWTHEIF